MKKLTSTILLLVCFSIYGFGQISTDTKEKNPPIAKYRMGSAMITVWENTNSKGNTWKTFEIEKLYKQDEVWKTNNSFDMNELLQLRAVIDKAIEEQGIVVEEN